MNNRFLHWGAAAAVVGGVLAVVGNALHPRFTSDDDAEVLRDIADSGIWVADHLLLVIGLVVIIGGVIAIARSLRTDGDDDLARYGELATVIGGAVALVSISMDALATRQVAEDFVAATGAEAQSRLDAAIAVGHVGSSIFAMWTLVLLGVSPLLLGMAAMRSARYPSWIGGAAAVGGIGSILVGLFILGGVDADWLTWAFLATSLLVTLWVIAAGVVLWRDTATTSAPPGRVAVSP